MIQEDLIQLMLRKRLPNVLSNAPDWDEAEKNAENHLHGPKIEVLAWVDNCPPNSQRHYRLAIARDSDGTIRFLSYDRGFVTANQRNFSSNKV